MPREGEEQGITETGSTSGRVQTIKDNDRLGSSTLGNPKCVVEERSGRSAS